jgi:hypothetical protein
MMLHASPLATQRLALRPQAGACGVAAPRRRNALRVCAAATLAPSAVKPVRLCYGCMLVVRDAESALGRSTLTVSLPDAQLSNKEGLELYKDMYLGRAFEDMCAQVRECTPARRDGGPLSREQ